MIFLLACKPPNSQTNSASKEIKGWRIRKKAPKEKSSVDNNLGFWRDQQ
jgi:hypothetical protein